MRFDKKIDNYTEQIVKSTQEIIRIKSTEDLSSKEYPFGEGVQKSLEYALNLCKNLGFKTKNVDNYAGYGEIGSGEEMVGILVHLDVVPEGDGWTFPPYSGTINDGKIYGRGSIDDKGPAIAAIYGMKAILDSSVQLTKRVRIIFGTNEETNWQGISYYLKNEETPTLGFTPDAEFPVIHGEKGILKLTVKKNFKDKVNDGGIEIIKLSGGLRSNMVPEYAFCQLKSNSSFEHILNAYNEDFNGGLTLENLGDGNFKVNAYGKSAHGSTPENGKNSISHLLSFLNHLDLQIGDQANLIRFAANKIGLETNGVSLDCNFSDEESGNLTLNLGTIDMDHDCGKYEIDIRYPVTTKLDDIICNFKSHMASYKDLELEISSHQAPLYTPKEDPLVKSLMKVYKEYTGDDTDPITIGGGTYARSAKNLVAFGCGFPGKPELAHQKDECVEISDLILSAKIFAAAIYELAK